MLIFAFIYVKIFLHLNNIDFKRYNMRNETVLSNIPNTNAKVQRRGREISTKTGLVSTMHYHNELEFISVYEGDFICEVYGKEYCAHAGEVIFINSRVPHSTKTDKPHRTGLLQFSETSFSDNEITDIIKYSMRFQSQLSCPVAVIKNPELFRVIDEIFTETEEKLRSYEVFVKANIYRILGILYRDGILSDSERLYNSPEIQKILPILSYVNSAYSENITLDEVSEKLGFDRSYFCRIFKAGTGATFTEYLNFVRICKAEKKLHTTKNSILEISEAVGFSSVSYFNRMFKKYRNCSPRFYRSVLCKNI